MKIVKEREKLQKEKSTIEERIIVADETVTTQQAQVEKLNKIINEADEERAKMKKEYALILNERVCEVSVIIVTAGHIQHSISA